MVKEYLKIGEVARLLGVSNKTIRYYQQIGLLAEPARSESGYRLYSATDLLRLQRIKRLRALGLPLEHIRELLPLDGPEGASQGLRAILLSLETAWSEQIRLLEEQREKVRRLLAEERLAELDGPTEPGAMFYLDSVLEQLEPLLTNVSPEALALERQLDALLGSFNWPEAYRVEMHAKMKQAADFFVQHPQEYRLLIELTERLALLAHVPEDSPEVQRFIEDVTESDALRRLAKMLGELLAPEVVSLDAGAHPFAHLLGDLTLSIYSPTQRRALEEAARRNPL